MAIEHHHHHADDHHPATRPAEPDHPMVLDGQSVPGDARLMAVCLIEELLLIAIEPDDIRRMSRNGGYQALFMARQALGDHALDQIIDEAASRVGVHRVRTIEHTGDVRQVTLTLGTT